MSEKHRPDYLFVRPRTSARKRTLMGMAWGIPWKCWVATVDAFQDYSPPCNGTYARRQGPATITFDGRRYWSQESRS